MRGLVSRPPRTGHIPALEKILIDMLMDLDKYNYIGRSDYIEIWKGLIQRYRIDIRVVHGYSKRRKCLEFRQRLLTFKLEADKFMYE